MPFSTSHDLLVVLSFAAGALHVLSPDHWLPLSVLAWQKQWSASRAAGVSALAYALHLLGGVAIYAAWVAADRGAELLFVTVALVLVFSVLRGFRFSRVREVVGAGPRGVWGLFAALSLLGPCELLAPILIKASNVGADPRVALAAFAAGTLVAGTAAVLNGSRSWARPFELARSLGHAYRRVRLQPVLVCSLVGWVLLATS